MRNSSWTRFNEKKVVELHRLCWTRSLQLELADKRTSWAGGTFIFQGYIIYTYFLYFLGFPQRFSLVKILHNYALIKNNRDQDWTEFIFIKLKTFRKSLPIYIYIWNIIIIIKINNRCVNKMLRKLYFKKVPLKCS